MGCSRVVIIWNNFDFDKIIYLYYVPLATVLSTRNAQLSLSLFVFHVFFLYTFLVFHFCALSVVLAVVVLVLEVVMLRFCTYHLLKGVYHELKEVT